MDSSKRELEEIILQIRQAREMENTTCQLIKSAVDDDNQERLMVLMKKAEEQEKTIEELETLVKGQKETIKKLEGLESAFYHLDVFIREKDATIEKLKEEKSKSKEIISKLEEHIKILEEQNKKLGGQSKKIEVLEEENERLTRDVREYKDGVKKLSDYLEEKNNEIERLEKKIEGLKKSYDILFDEGVISEGKKDEKIKKLEEENKRLRKGQGENSPKEKKKITRDELIEELEEEQNDDYDSESSSGSGEKEKKTYLEFEKLKCSEVNEIFRELGCKSDYHFETLGEAKRAIKECHKYLYVPQAKELARKFCSLKDFKRVTGVSFTKAKTLNLQNFFNLLYYGVVFTDK